MAYSMEKKKEYMALYEIKNKDKIATRRRKLRLLKKKSNTCVRCSSVDICNKKSILSGKKTKELLCVVCYLKRFSKKYLGRSTRWEEIEKMFNSQNGKCYYSGITLVIGDNASIDHRVPRSKDGKNEISNLNFVDWRVNVMKRSLLEEDFIYICKKIAEIN